MYPNPTSGIITIGAGSTSPGARIEIYDFLGNSVLETELHTSHQVIDLRGLPAGVYFLQLRTPNGKLTRKIVKE